jgi:hypothetical protein
VKDVAVVAEKDAVAVVGEKDVAEVVGEKVVAAAEEEEEEEGTRSSKYPNQYWRHPCEYHRLCVREKRNSQLKEGTKPPVDIRSHRRGELYSPV